MKSTLEISEIENILGWSYPTALTFAKKNGQLLDVGFARGKWYVPCSIIEEEIIKLENEATRARDVYISICKGDSNDE